MNDEISILVIDDEEGMREGMKRILTRRGYSVDTAENGETAISLIQGKNYDIALVDLKMPGISGFEVAEYINNRDDISTVVVIVSALATVEAAVEVTRHGAFDFLVKPFTPDDLVPVVERAVRQRNLIHERERYLSELNSERTLSRQLINAMQEGLVVLNMRKEPVLINTRAEFYLGTRFTEGLAVGSLGFDETVLGYIDELIAASAPAGETRMVTTRVKDAMVQVRVHPMVRQGELTGIIIILLDVTDEWEAEQDKNRFLSMVVHELRSPLAAIINYLNIILTGMFDDNPGKIRDVLERCKVRGEDLLDLIRDLLELNKRDAGKVEKTYRNLDLIEVLTEQIDFLKVQAARRNIAVELHVAEGIDGTISADKGDLDRIFMNLISNGIKYNRDNGRLDVTVDRADAFVITFADTGIGISEKDLENLFQEFYRVRSPKTSTITGTGLGLATVKRVLGDYNGRIEVESVSDRGTTFTVTIPLSNAE